MDKKELQKKLNKPYSTDNWREVVQFVFPNVQILNPPMVIPIDNEKVEQFRQLGNVQLHDGKSLALFELKLKENVNILRNRVELNNLVSQYIDQDQTHGVLSIFEKGGNDYRFTFSASASEFDEEEGDFVTKKTDTKRFTYVLGKNESCKTPAQRFYELSENKNKAEIKDIENAFSVEKLSKAFFKEYKDQYTTFVNYMMQTPGIFKAIYSEDDKAIRDFVKILLGRIIFIKFVQKKGWMGVDAASKKWENGDFRFIENGFANFKHQDLFYSTFLEPLFEALDEPNRPNDIFTVTNTRVPYLSGGLFELEDKKTKNINFPAKYFNDLFEFLDRYNFTIDENDTNDHEVGIDPEMLGHIFENLLEDNKDKGAFYTPKEIVRYMCQESLKEYLKTSLENNKQWPTDETEAKDFEQALHNFVTKKEAGGIIEFEETIARALKEVKICDPAIGSGAFPMGLLNEIFQLVHKLHEANKDKVERVWELKGWQPNLVKQNIIQNSIYGVDIEKGAVDVARLRFWLSLIVDEPEPKALPHLDYKIVVGNSLVSKLEDTIIDIDWNLDETQHGFFGSTLAQERAEILQKISEKQKAVFDPNSDEEKLSLEIRNLKIDLLCKQLELMINNQNIPKEPKIADYQNKPKAKFTQDQAKYFEALGWKDQITKLQKLKNDPNGILHFFDWKLDFPEIMSEEIAIELNRKVGFDILIANPPYVEFKNLDKKIKDELILFYKTLQGKFDIYIAFFELYHKLTTIEGSIISINPTRFLQRDYGVALRCFISEKYRFLSITDFVDKQVFENALAYTGIFHLKNEVRNEYNFKYSRAKSNKIITKTEELFFKNNDSQFEYMYFDNSRLNESVWNFKNDGLEIIFDKIRNNSDKLSEILDGIYQGIATGKDEVFLLKDEKIKELNLERGLLKKFIKGKDIGPYSINYKNTYLIYPYDDEGKVINETDFKNNYPNLYNYLKSKVKELSGRSYFEKSSKIWFELWNQRNPKRFEQVKIVTLDNAKINSFALDFNNFFGATTVYNLIKKDADINFYIELLSLLNSKLLSFYHAHNTIPQAGGYLRYQALFINDLPIKFGLSKNLLKKIKTNNFKPNSQIIDEINTEVYKLYELTYDEVLVVEPEFIERMSKEEYEGLKVE